MATATKPSPIPQPSTPSGASYGKSNPTHTHRLRQSLFVIADLCGIASGALLAIAIHFPTTPAVLRFLIPEHIGISVLYAVLIILFCHTQRLYSVYQPASFTTEFASILKSVLMATIVLGGCLFLTGTKSTSRLIIACTAISAIVTMTVWRQYRRHTLKKAVADGLSCHNVLIVGTDPLAQAVAQHLALHRQFGFVVLGHLTIADQPVSSDVDQLRFPPGRTAAADLRSYGPSLPDQHLIEFESSALEPNSAPSDQIPCSADLLPSHSRPPGSGAVSTDSAPTLKILGTLDNLRTLCRTHFIDEIIVCAQNLCAQETGTSHRQTILEVISEARESGVGVRVIPDLYDGLAWGARLDYLGDFPTLAVVHRSMPAFAMSLKRLIDVLGSGLALILLSPLLLLLALIVKLDSKGPVLYASKRLGRKGRPFPCYKFRTMIVGADIQRAKLQHLNERDSILFKITNDPRITRVGRFFRKHSLDELPQFWNVLRGDMSLVGPRPPLAHEVKKYETGYFRRLEVAPGITGLWQVEARNNPSFDKYISLDLHYIENWSLGLDLQILFRTVAVVLSGTGS